MSSLGRHDAFRTCAAACAGLLVASLVAESLVSQAAAQGMRIFRPITRSVTDQRRIIEASRVSLRVIRPKLGFAAGKAAPETFDLALNDDRSLLLVLLQDGTTRLWDLEDGVQLLRSTEGGLIGGVLHGRGRNTEAYGVRRGGRPIRLLAVGSRRDPGDASAVARDGIPVVRTRDGWYLIDGDRGRKLEDAARHFTPTTSEGGARLFYLRTEGTVASVDIASGRASAAAPLGTCRDGVAVTAGSHTSDRDFVFLGDEQGNVCLKNIPTDGTLSEEPPNVIEGHQGPVRAVAADRDRSHFATYDGSGKVQVWSIAPSLHLEGSVDLEKETTGAIALDSWRQWVLVGERNGTVGVYSYARAEDARIAGLISLSDSNWMVLDRKGRFDGPQGGGDGLVWVGDTASDTLPVNAFSERYFEPGLLAKLDDASPQFLNDGIRDIREDGYLLPPAVRVEPPDADLAAAGDQVPIRVRLADPNYPKDKVSEIRLYHNGKLTPRQLTRADPDSGVFEFRVRLVPGDNTFRAVGVGPDGVEGRPGTAPPVTVHVPAGRRTRLRIVSIGINDYIRPAWALSHSRNDAETVVAALREQGKGLFEEIGVATLLDSAASAKAIKDYISRETPKPQDILVVFFAGHGYALQEDNGWEWYLFPYTVRWSEQTTISDETIRRYGVSSKSLLRDLTRVPERRVFLVLDSCRSGAVIDAIRGLGTDRTAERKVLRKIARVGGIHVLAASRGDEDAIELRSVPHGALTFLFLEGIKGKADNNSDREITVREMVDYAIREMPLLSRRLVSESISQMPVGYSHGADFGIARH